MNPTPSHFPLSTPFKFTCDAMLGDLARKLRFLGYDTLYVGELERNETRVDQMETAPLEDGEILHVARESGRTVLTKDVAFASRDPSVILLVGNDVKDHLVKLQEMLGLGVAFDQDNSRCFKCNESLVRVAKGDVRGKVQEKTFESFDIFFQCPACKQVFWRGAHFHDGKGGFLAAFGGFDKESENHA